MPQTIFFINKDVVTLVKKYEDIIASVFVLLFAGWYFAVSRNIQIMDKYGGAALIPNLCTGILVVCALTLLYRAIRKINKAKTAPAKDVSAEKAVKSEAEAAPEIKSNYKLVVLTLVAISLYALLFSVIGFISATILYLVGQIMMLQPKRNVKTLIIALITALIVAFFVYYIFFNVFYVVLPTGTLWVNM